VAGSHLVFGGLTLLLGNISGDSPISAGLIYFANWGAAARRRGLRAGLVATARR
jgi:hypothetical protein